MPNFKEKILAHLSQEVCCHLDVSPVGGMSVFAIRAISKGVNPMRSRLKFDEVKFAHA
jgi:hypothetical protein